MIATRVICVFIMKKFIAIFILLISIANPCTVLGQTSLDRTYKNMPVLDFIYETGIDDEESEDYEGYVISPYVLVRLPVKLRCQKVVLDQGYYLVKPEYRYGHNFAVFKQNGRIMAVVPVYKKYRIDPTAVFPTPPKPKHKWYVQPFVTAWNIVKWPFSKIFKQRKIKIPSRAKVELDALENNSYYDLGLYVESSLYKMLFIPEP